MLTETLLQSADFSVCKARTCTKDAECEKIAPSQWETGAPEDIHLFNIHYRDAL